jgi:hypothetical protein
MTHVVCNNDRMKCCGGNVVMVLCGGDMVRCSPGPGLGTFSDCSSLLSFTRYAFVLEKAVNVAWLMKSRKLASTYLHCLFLWHKAGKQVQGQDLECHSGVVN